MSEMETHVGKLRKIDRQGKSMEDWCMEKCMDEGITELHPSYTSWEELFIDDSYETYFIVDGEIWELFDHKDLNDYDIYEMTPNPDGTVSFTMRFYNGGTCLSECIEEGLQELNKK